MSSEPRRRTRVAASAVCGQDDAILLARIAPGYTAHLEGRWTLPGGGVSFGEAPEDAVLRELSEETGLVGEVESIVGVSSWVGGFDDPRDGTPTELHAVRILYRVRIVGGTLRAERGGSTDACAWIRRHELAALPLVDIAEIGARELGLLTPSG